eukprot:Skav230440  [mRNA]  locus=scaffold3496:2145:3154:+ [translate_table: standard]
MTLKEKVKKLKEECSDEEAAAAELQLQLTPAEKSRGWSKHQTHLCKKGNENEKQEFDEASKKDKGFKTALFLLKTSAPSFRNVQQKAKTKNELIMREKWMSEKEAYDRFGDDLEKHLASGRVSWREDRRTWGTYEYLDNDDYERKVTGTKELEWSHFQEYEMGGSDEEHWGKHFDKDLQSLLLDHTPGKGSSLAKGSGKGKGKGKGKGGKGNPNPNPPKAIEDLPLDQQMPEALKKLKKTKDLLTQMHSNFEEALAKVKGLNFLTKPAIKEKEKAKLDTLKATLTEAVATMANAREESKDLVQISMRTQSKASKK